MLARSVATAGLLSGGRTGLGSGAGGSWDAIGSTGGLTVDGAHGQPARGRAGLAPAHSPGIWIGSCKPQILRTTGRTSAGWLPSLQHLPGGVSDLTAVDDSVDRGFLQGSTALIEGR